MPLTDCCSICEQQMKYVIDQLVTLYPEKTFDFILEDGGTASGTPHSILTDINKGVFCIECTQVTTGGSSTQEYINIGKIASFTINNAGYNTEINYIPAPLPPIRCGCEESLRSILTENTNVKISLAGTSLEVGKVIKNEFGIVVIETGDNIQFVATCKIEKVQIIPIV